MKFLQGHVTDELLAHRFRFHDEKKYIKFLMNYLAATRIFHIFANG
jgi:hypothetical protein